MRSLSRVAGSFVIVLVLYWAYALAAVPLIEPPADPRAAQQDDDDDASNTASLERRINELEGLFPPNSWQLTNPKIIESGQVRLLLREYRNLGNGVIEIRPCSMVQMPEGVAADDVQERRRAVILDAPDGATLQFDKPIELRRAEVGRLVSGRLRGTVTIRSEGRSSGPEDDLRILTQDIELTEREIWTDSAVDFRFGPNYGHGQKMRIRLSQGSASKHTALGPNIGGLESFELRQVDRLHLEPRGAKPAQGQAGAAPAGPLSKALPVDTPMEISCRGSFFFEMEGRSATFQKNVDVLRLVPNGPADRLSCDLLTIYFEPRADREAKPGPDGQPGLTDLVPRRMEAVGNPVALSSQAQDVQARGQRLTYDLVTQRVRLEGAEEAWLRQGPNEIHGMSFEYRPGAQGQLGEVEAKGGGWLRAEMRSLQPGAAPRDGEPQTVEAVWGTELRVQPDGEFKKVSLTGGSRLRLPQLGQLDGREIDFWIKELPQGVPGRTRFVPDRMRAEKDVRIDSAQMTGVLQQMDVTFLPPQTAAQTAATIAWLYWTSMQLPADQPAPGPATPAGGAYAAQPQAFPMVRLADGSVAPARQAMPAAAAPPLSSPLAPSATPPAAPPQRFHVEGRTLTARVILTEPQAELAELVIQDNVRLEQIQGATLEEKPLLVTGDRILATQPSRPIGTITVVGRPAHFEWRGLGLTGLNINLNRGSNRLWVDGPGNMDVPMGNGAAGPALGAAPGTAAPAMAAAAMLATTSGMLRVRWHEAMNFNGQTAVFQTMVSAEAPERHLETETLEVGFREPVRFDQNATRQQPQVELLVCRGGVWMESTSTAKDGRRATLERTEFREISLNLVDGAAKATGPGWLSRVGLASSMTLPGEAAAPKPAPGAQVWSEGPPGYGQNAAADPNALSALLVRFQGNAVGNIHRRAMTFYDRVQAGLGPVAHWDATPDLDHPERLGPRGATLLCEEMAVVEMPNPLDGQSSVELEARRNVVIEAQNFTARAGRVAYVQMKDMLILEGDGRTDARLFREPVPGDPRPGDLSAQRIWFWPATRRVHVEGARSLDLNQFPRR